MPWRLNSTRNNPLKTTLGPHVKQLGYVKQIIPKKFAGQTASLGIAVSFASLKGRGNIRVSKLPENRQQEVLSRLGLLFTVLDQTPGPSNQKLALDCGSKSTSRTSYRFLLKWACARQAARFTARVVLPTPPLKLIMLMILPGMLTPGKDQTP